MRLSQRESVARHIIPIEGRYKRKFKVDEEPTPVEN